MRAIASRPGTTAIELVDVPAPVIERPEQLLIEVARVGVCGTDREIAEGYVGHPPPGEERLIIGHEMLGRVADVGTQVRGFQPGDWVVATVRRGCGRCLCCRQGHSDFCTSGGYTEHGIKELHGFMAEYIVDDPAYVVKLPPELADIGVLLEPLAVGEKALEQVRCVLRRLPCPPGRPEQPMAEPGWAEGIRALVAGSGPIGLLGAMILRAHGAEVHVVDLASEDALSTRIIQRIGARHISGRALGATDLDDALGQVDVIFEATGAAQFSFNLIDALGVNGVYVMTGIPGEARDVPLPAGLLMQQIVLKNQTIFGSVNASLANFKQGIADLQRFRALWGALPAEIITERVPMERFREALESKSVHEIKSVIEIAAH